MAAAIAGALVCGAVWIGLRGPVSLEDRASLRAQDPIRVEARMRARVKAVEGRIAVLEAAVEDRGSALAALEERLAELDDG